MALKTLRVKEDRIRVNVCRCEPCKIKLVEVGPINYNTYQGFKRGFRYWYNKLNLGWNDEVDEIIAGELDKGERFELHYRFDDTPCIFEADPLLRQIYAFLEVLEIIEMQ